MLLMLLSTESEIPDLISDSTPESLTVTIKCPSGEAVPCIIESTKVLGKDLLEKVEEMTSVPTTICSCCPIELNSYIQI